MRGKRPHGSLTMQRKPPSSAGDRPAVAASRPLGRQRVRTPEREAGRMPPARRSPQGSLVTPTSALLAIAAFFGLLLLFVLARPDLARAWGLSFARPWVLGAAWYGIASVVSFALHAIDKQAAVRGGQRVSERSLLLTALVGGWPGASLAQRALRHKTSKPAFQWAFGAMVGLNLLALALALWHAQGATGWRWASLWNAL